MFSFAKKLKLILGLFEKNKNWGFEGVFIKKLGFLLRFF
jgi:hypothetical protein